MPQENFSDFFASLGEDINSPKLKNTAARLFKLWGKLLSGYKKTPQSALGGVFETTAQDLIKLEGIRFYSICEHHLMPFFGRVDISYLPKKHICGISSLSGVVEVFSRRLQIQERLNAQIANFLYEALDPVWLCVDIKARHLCAITQDLDDEMQFVTSAVRGVK